MMTKWIILGLAGMAVILGIAFWNWAHPAPVLPSTSSTYSSVSNTYAQGWGFFQSMWDWCVQMWQRMGAWMRMQGWMGFSRPGSWRCMGHETRESYNPWGQYGSPSGTMNH